jgi:hypothetical protein
MRGRTSSTCDVLWADVGADRLGIIVGATDDFHMMTIEIRRMGFVKAPEPIRNLRATDIKTAAP